MIGALVPGKGMVALAAISAIAIGALWLDGDRVAAERNLAREQERSARDLAAESAASAKLLADQNKVAMQVVSETHRRELASAAAGSQAKAAITTSPRGPADCLVPDGILEALRERQQRGKP